MEFAKINSFGFQSIENNSLKPALNTFSDKYFIFCPFQWFRNVVNENAVSRLSSQCISSLWSLAPSMWNWMVWSVSDNPCESNIFMNKYGRYFFFPKCWKATLPTVNPQLNLNGPHDVKRNIDCFASFFMSWKVLQKLSSRWTTDARFGQNATLDVRTVHTLRCSIWPFDVK